MLTDQKITLKKQIHKLKPSSKKKQIHKLFDSYFLLKQYKLFVSRFKALWVSRWLLVNAHKSGQSIA